MSKEDLHLLMTLGFLVEVEVIIKDKTILNEEQILNNETNIENSTPLSTSISYSVLDKNHKPVAQGLESKKELFEILNGLIQDING